MEKEKRFKIIKNLDNMCRAVIPKEFRDFLGITDKVAFVEKDGKIYLEAVKDEKED